MARQMTERDFDFYRRRLQEERMWATKAITPEARLAHALLAAGYSDRMRTLSHDDSFG